MYSYFVAYVHAQGHGYLEITSPAPITNIHIVNEMNDAVIQQTGHPTASITGWQLLSGPTTT